MHQSIQLIIAYDTSTISRMEITKNLPAN